MVNRSFGMSLFFMIAGYFAAYSCEKSGPRAFAMNRLQRLGIPLLIFSILIMLLQVFLVGPLDSGELGAAWPVDVMHLWFVQHLILYSLGYALWVAVHSRAGKSVARPANPSGYAAILLFALGLALATAIVRTWYSIDDWVYLLGYLRVAFADVPRDLSLFVVGILAYNRQWVSSFSSRAGRVWLGVGLALAALWYAYDLWLVDLVVFSDTIWGILIPIWEALLCCSMCIGLTVWFRDRLNTQGLLLKEMGKSSYTAYILHVFVVLLFQFLAVGWAAPPLLKFLVVSVVSVTATFALSSLVRRPLGI